MEIEYYCPECDGTNVSCSCMWDTETQQWEIRDPGEDWSDILAIHGVDTWCDECNKSIRKELLQREIKSE